MKLNAKKTIYVGIAFLIISMFWQVYDTVIAQILINSFGLNQTTSGIVMALDNVLALFLLPLFGSLSDKTKTKRGRRTPYIFFGTIAAAVLVTGVALFDNAQQNLLRQEGVSNVVTTDMTKIDNYESKEFGIIISVESDVETIVKVTYNESKKAFYYELDGVETKYIGTKHYTYKDKVYGVKELAVNARSIDVTVVRNNNMFLFVGVVGVLLFVLIAMATYRTPAVSLMPDVTVKPLRSKANAIINLMGTAGGIISLGFMSVLNKEYTSNIPTFACLSVLMIVGLCIFLWKVNEPKLVKEMEEDAEKYGLVEEEEKVEETSSNNDKMPKDVRTSFILILISIVFWFMGYNAATSKFSVYAVNILGTSFTTPLLVAQACAVVAFIPIGIIASKIGRRKTILIGITILFTAFVLGTLANADTIFLIYVTMGLAGVGWATINVNSYPMIVEMARGNNVGKYTGYYYSASMFAQILTPILSGLIMDLTGTMKVLFPYCALFIAAAFVTMFFVKHGDSKPIPKKSALEAFDNDD